MFNYVSLHSSITFYHIDLCSLHSYTTLYTPLKNTSKHTCSDSLNLKPPEPPYPLQDFKALYKCCIIIIIIIIWYPGGVQVGHGYCWV